MALDVVADIGRDDASSCLALAAKRISGELTGSQLLPTRGLIPATPTLLIAVAVIQFGPLFSLGEMSGPEGLGLGSHYVGIAFALDLNR